jgi:hypothetical protein
MAPSLWWHYVSSLLIVEQLTGKKRFLIQNNYIIELNIKLSIKINIVKGEK